MNPWGALVFGAAALWYSLRNRAAAGAGDVRIDAPTEEVNYGTSQTQTPTTQEERTFSQASMSAWATPIAGAQYQSAFETATMLYRLPVGMLSRMAWQESRYNSAARSPVGAIGLMQFMPATAAEWNIDPTDPWQSIDAAGRYMAQLYSRFSDWRTALAAYNWGQGNVAHFGTDNLPHETQAYVEAIAGDIGL